MLSHGMCSTIGNVFISAPQVLSKVHQQEMVRYLYNHQNADGGFGLHIEGESTMFGTGLRWGHLITAAAAAAGLLT